MGIGVWHKRTRRANRGQMTVELAVCIPVFIAISLVVFNALVFFEQCAAFDCLARDAVRIYAASPARGQGASESVAFIQSSLDSAFTAENIEVSVSSAASDFGFVRYTATIAYTPTLFGRSFLGQVFDTRLGTLSHSVHLTIDPYKPGVVF